jgi:glutamine cyclotransferase
MKPRLPLIVMPPLVIVCLCMALSCGSKAPPTIVPHIVTTIPHDTAAFTQGLFYHGGRLYESNGLYGQSGLSVIDAKNGSILKRLSVSPGVFAEGCTRIGDEIIQLTWREQVAFVYSLAALTQRRTLTYAGEGWGITSDGKKFYMSDGSDTVTIRNRDFAIIGRLPVKARDLPVTKLNELEWANGKLYANIWYSDRIAEINPKNGRVLRFIDCSELTKREQPASPDHVLNGIAFDSATGTFYLAGKKWKYLFVVKID